MNIDTLLKFIGHFHPLFVHLPIGILLVGLLLQLISRIEKYSKVQHAVPVLILLGGIFAVLSCITGFFLSLSGEYEGATLDWHMWLGIGVALAALVLYIKLSAGKFDLLTKILVIATVILVSVTGHLGGTLTHGSGYLMSAFNDTGSGNEIEKVIPDVQEALAYNDIVQPMLQARCYNCHGPNKQKGKFRMDSPELLLKGGEDGVVIVPGDAGKSELIRRLLLPLEDEHHMAPDGKQQLTEDQVALLHWWIEEGADFTKNVKNIEQPEKIKPLLLALQSDQQEIKDPPIVPSVPVDRAKEEDIQKLKDAGLVVMPIAQNSNYLMVNFVMVPTAGDKEAALLASIKEQLIWLKIGGTKITDAALPVIGSCKNLIRLQLNNTAVSDAGIASLKNLTLLQSLNLVGTEVSAKGLKELKGLKNLQAVFLYKSAVDRNDFKQLEQLFATVFLDTGGYIVPTLVSDTTRLK